ncbi:heterokaryon incompatibility protein [Colletotrichum kahawae]|uniref:Heterokaryon incompatibility protein n=1 Tax=Colletotrichum kahawae TaxID=34407 RepID=A0AAD9Y343_COLKA|nr:heterokaryon incompatibility protein [Colletotrichum kahawae]
MTLSHRWDHLTGEEAQLTVRNIDSRIEGLSLSSLPPSFRYAAFLTRQLGIRYLWIDSLCILQDSRDDWLRESVQMGEVYSASYCTIATSNDALENYNNQYQQLNDDSQHVRECFNASEDEDTILPRWVGLNLLGERRSHIPSNQNHVRLFDSEPWDWEETIDQTVLSGRAWTLQERQLSRRVIHVTSSSLLWECRTSRGSEQVPWTDQVAANMKTEARYRINDSIKNNRQIFQKDSPSYFYNLWYEIIWDYSNRLLTEESDKLPGLAGLAHTLANMIGDEYVAGLWKKDIVSGLLWKTRRWNMNEEYRGRRIPRRSIRPSPPGFAPSGPHGAIQHTRPSCWRAPS